MEIRYPSNPNDFEAYTTDRIRSEFLLQDLFTRGRMALTYSHFDRMIIGGICPSEPLQLEAGKTGGGSDASIASNIGVATIDGLGPDGDGIHAEHEHLLLPTLIERTAFLTELLCRL